MRAAIFIVVFVCIVSVNAFVSQISQLGTRTSALSIARTSLQRNAAHNGAAGLTMKRKGKQNGPQVGSRGGMGVSPEEALAAARASAPKGFPSFELFARSRRAAGIWYPCGCLGGDERSKATVDGYVSGFLTDLNRQVIEKGIADAILGPEKAKLRESVVRMYPALQMVKNELEYGFRINYPPLQEKMGPQKITLLTEDMRLSMMDKMKKKFGFGG